MCRLKNSLFTESLKNLMFVILRKVISKKLKYLPNTSFFLLMKKRKELKNKTKCFA